jgi:hypothetical protein
MEKELIVWKTPDQGTYRGYVVKFTNSSYSCPKLDLFGFGRDFQLMNTINLRIKRMEEKINRDAFREQKFPREK